MKKDLLFILIILTLFFWGCSEPLPRIDKITESCKLVNQEDIDITYPDKYIGNIFVVGYIFTNCPDICPLTTNNMRLLKEKLDEEKIPGVKFVSISFDPEHDSPHIFRKYIRARDLNTNDWDFLTGSKPEIGRLIKNAGIMTVPTDTVKKSSGEDIVFFAHTDRISLYDKQGYLRKDYPGSTLNVDEILNDIKSLGGE